MSQHFLMQNGQNSNSVSFSIPGTQFKSLDFHRDTKSEAILNFTLCVLFSSLIFFIKLNVFNCCNVFNISLTVGADSLSLHCKIANGNVLNPDWIGNCKFNGIIPIITSSVPLFGRPSTLNLNTRSCGRGVSGNSEVWIRQMRVNTSLASTVHEKY